MEVWATGEAQRTHRLALKTCGTRHTSIMVTWEKEKNGD
jgi:hypothetical protein